MDRESIEVYLRIRHPSLDPEEITQHLGLVPEHHWRAGDKRPEVGDTPSRSTYAESYWIGLVQIPPGALAQAPSGFDDRLTLEGMLVLAAALLKSRKALWKRISEEGGRAELLVTLESDGAASIDLTPEAMSILNGIGLSISVASQDSIAAA